MNVPKCPSCHQSDVRVLDGQYAICKPCSKLKRSVFQFCLACQREWPRNSPTTDSCTLPNCSLRAALLSNTEITDPHSSTQDSERLLFQWLPPLGSPDWGRTQFNRGPPTSRDHKPKIKVLFWSHSGSSQTLCVLMGRVLAMPLN
ncbi:hypothetical protein G5714_005655 [Onychostoma macrolepis]|uniref:Uncharacterized protein n=1 Tax=Onychostoma macrolepis TaxID=369639 RepID=A0A7J6D1M6_9TELE|nr:hypothetical protein G5714_005655 [Onychostoma macrolepis]